jgi:DNA modification methylase
MKQERLFNTKIVPGKEGSEDLFDEEYDIEKGGPVTCLGLTFDNDDARRAHFTEELRKKLKDPTFREIEGFPIGEDEDILNLSDPPYYTACPNPWIADFIAEWEDQKPKYLQDKPYHREPFAADVSEGKSDPIYNAHSYHTKVPHKAIMRYILHYTEPGDIVFDGFAGTGMTGVAAQMCGDREVVMSLGYQVKQDGTILQEETDEDGKKVWRRFSMLGIRKATLNDLSPLASFVASNYNTAIDSAQFENEAQKVLKAVEGECTWMYQTKHTHGLKGNVICTVWSDVFVCPECAHEMVYWEVAVDIERGVIEDVFSCSSCNTSLNKRAMERAWETVYDDTLQAPIKQAKRTPVLIVYKYQGKRFEKRPDAEDFKLLEEIQQKQIPHWFPKERMPLGKETRRNDPAGITHVHHFYTKRNLFALSTFVSAAKQSPIFNSLQYQLDSLVIRQSKLTRFLVSYYFHGGGGWVGTPLSGTLYIPSFSVEVQPFETWSNRIRKTLARVTNEQMSFVCSTGSAANTGIPASSIDYLFLDPPFGANINYSELSFLWESWLSIRTNNKKEAIENSIQQKGINEYRQLMTECFHEAYRVLKPGRWMTVEFSNTKASVWNSIQVALTEAGFIVANVSALDKKQGSFKAVTTPTAVKQDLVISAYKPNGGFEERFLNEAQTEEGVWDFIRTHLKYLPVIKQQGSILQLVPERDPRILFDQMVTYYVRKGYRIPTSSHEFQSGLAQRFIERDGMFFLSDQVSEYDRKKMSSEQPSQASLFVSDESSAIQWLRQLIKEKPQAFSDINPQFMKQLGGWSKNEAQLDLRELLNQNFICYDGKDPVPEQIHAYLSTNWKELRNLPKDEPDLVSKARDRWYVPDPNKAEQVEKMREKDLLREFELYKARTKKFKNRERFRIEAVRAGFKKAWQERDYSTIISVSEKIPNNVLEEDPKLLMWYDQAVTRIGAELENE